ncbi:MAG: prolyl oligopeptidase family serine peptidase [Leadbetterella sp.]
MRLVFAFLIVSMGISFAQEIKDTFQVKSFTDSRGTTLPYRVVLPINFDSTKKYPLLLILHGGGERGSDNITQLKYIKEFVLKVQDHEPAIVLMPQCPTTDYWASVKFDRSLKPPYVFDHNYKKYEETKSLHAVVELIQKHIDDKTANVNRIYIMGWSMGGMGTFEAVYRYPKLFAAAVPVCAGGDVIGYRSLQTKTVFYVFHGVEDDVITVDNSQKMVDELKRSKKKYTYKTYPGVKHDSWNNVLAEPTIITKLMAHKNKN